MKKNPYPGKFIAFEGLDGSGQTTQANLLKEHFQKKGCKAILTKEPTSLSKFGKKIRKILGKEVAVSGKQLQQLFAKDRNWHQNKIIIPQLKKGTTVINDRSQFSSFAFGAANGIDLGYLIELNKEFIQPDLVFLLKTSPKTSIQRIDQRGEKKTLFEREQQLSKVWKVFEKLPERFPNIVVLNGENTIKKIHKQVWQIIQRKNIYK